MEIFPRIPLLLRSAIPLSVLLALACSCRKQETESPPQADSVPGYAKTDSVIPRPDSVARSPEDSGSLVRGLRWPEPSGAPELAEILQRSAQLVEVKRRLDDLARNARFASGQAGSGNDSERTLDIPFEDSLSAWIERYRATLAEPSGSLAWPVQARYSPDIVSELASQLPRISRSKFLEGRSVYFVGGAPLLSKDLSEGGSAFLDLEGKPEFRYSTSLNDASNHLVAAMRAVPGTRIEVRSGPPLEDHESGPYGVGRIGSLDHVAKTPLRAWFLTASGPVPARIVSVRHNLFEQDICLAHPTQAVFASATQPDDIFGIYLPQDGIAPPRSIVSRHGKIATVDLDGDGIPEFAGIVEPFTGIYDDELARAVWFVNIDGAWKPVDSGHHEDCT